MPGCKHLDSGCPLCLIVPRSVHMVLPGGLWQVCLLAFSFLKAEANSVSYDASCMFVFISLIKLFIAFVSQQTIPLACLPPFIPSTPSPSPSENITINYCLFCSDRNLCLLWESRMNVFVPMTHRHNIDSVRTCVFSRFESCPTLCGPWTVAHQAPPSMGFSRQEYWSGLPCPPPGDLPDSGIKPTSPALQVNSLLPSHQGSPIVTIHPCIISETY